MKYLVIVESPAKCQKIAKYLNDNDDLNIYEVVATMGHITELKTLNNIDIANNFKCNYELVESKKKNTENIRKKIKKFDEVIIACDGDREGEGISAAICETFKLDILKTKRIIFNEITETAIINAFKSPRLVDNNLVKAQQTRQILDMLVGFKISPILWKYVSKYSKNPLSAGRCQTPALRLIYENQLEIDNSIPKKVYNTVGYFTNLNIPFELTKQFESEQEVIDFLGGSSTFSHIYTCSEPIKIIKKQPEPFTTSRIQQVASNEYHYSPKDTMRLCQNLYEGGYITYMRTDSKTYSRDFIESTKEYILRNYSSYGEKLINENIDVLISGNKSVEKLKTKSRSKKVKENEEVKMTQDAHEAIRPTNISLYNLPENFNSKEKNIYKLIWENTLESCMSNALFYSITAKISSFNKNVFTYKSEQVYFPGWLIVKNKYNKESKDYNYLKIIKQNDIIPYKKITSKVSVTGLKQHYSEARLVQLLEENGIGRPSTFSSLVDKIQDREYVKKQNVKGSVFECKDYELVDSEIYEEEIKREYGNENNKLVIQPLGKIVMEFLDKHFLSILNYEYTKNMEDDLDKISKGDKLCHELCSECNIELDKLISNLTGYDKIEFDIDDTNKFMIGKYGPIIKHTENVNGIENVTFKPVKDNIDISKLEKGDLTIDDVIDTDVKQKYNIIGKYNGFDVIIKKGKFGLYLKYGENTKSLKSFGNRPIENITFDEIKEYLEEGKTLIREVSNNISIRRGAKGDYIFYKTPKMKKPQFYVLNDFNKDTNQNYKFCDVIVLKNWIKEKHQIY